jgi:tetratricopeptide (TPR) repeat protein
MSHRTPRAAILLAGLASLLAAAPPAAAQGGGVTDTIQGLVKQCNPRNTGPCDDAISILDRELSLNPSWGWGQLMYGHALRGKGESLDAIARYRIAQKKDPELFLAYYSEAAIHWGQQEYDKVVSTLDKAPFGTADKRLARAGRVLLGKAHAEEENWGEAVKNLEGNAGDYGSYRALGIAYYNLGEWGKAADALEGALAQSRKPRNSDADQAQVAELAAEARLNQAAGGSDGEKKAAYRKALASAREAVKKAPAGVGAWENLGEAALGAQEYKEAERAFRKVLELKSGDCHATMNLGQTLLGAKRYRDAAGYLEKATGCLQGPAQRNAWVQLGFARLGAAKSVCPKCEKDLAECDEDKAIRRKAIAAYQSSEKAFQSGGSQGQAQKAAGAIVNLEGQIRGIDQNIRIREDNEKARLEQLKIWRFEIETDKAKDADRDGVPDPQDKCPGEPSPGDPVGLDGCPYKPPCP